MSDKPLNSEDQSSELSTLDILNLNDSELQREEVPEWSKNGKPGVVFLRVLSAAEALKFNELIANPATKKEALPRLVAYAMADANGNRLIADHQIDAFKARSVKVFMRLQDKIMKLNGFDKADKERKEETKND